MTQVTRASLKLSLGSGQLQQPGEGVVYLYISPQESLTRGEKESRTIRGKT